MAWDWDQKRKQIAATLNNPKSGGGGWGGALASIGAGIEANPSLRWGPQADVEMAGGQAATGGNQSGLFGDNTLLGGLWDHIQGNLAPTPNAPNLASMDEAARQRLLQARGGLY
jgi:hypothetical protein